MFKKILVYFVSWRLVLYLAALLATFFLPQQYLFTNFKSFGPFRPYLVWIWGNFDGVHYVEIARRGYSALEQGFFPLYPLLIHLLAPFYSLLSAPYSVAGQVISTFCLLGALFLLVRLATLDNYKKLIPYLLAAVFFFPTSFYLVSVYNDSLFLLLATATLYLARQKKVCVGQR